MGRKKLGIWIPDEDIWKKFVSKVAEIHGQTYGRTGEELEEAILLWLENKKRAATGRDREDAARWRGPDKYAIIKDSLSEDLGRPVPENKNVERLAGEVMAIKSRARKV